MSILNIRPAKRTGARLVIGICGPSGGGKTYTALQLAWGLANGVASKVGMLDTENRRGSLYSDILVDKKKKSHEFLIGDLDAPFSPQRFIDAMLEFQAAGVEVLVIDTVSHEWAGLGGVLSIVAGYDKSIHGWKVAKPAHQRFMSTMLQCDMHIIVCVRASNKTDWKDPKNPKSLGIMPIQQEEFMFEMTASMMLAAGGKQRDVLKCPEDLVPIFGQPGEWHEGFLTANHGLSLRKWVDGGVTVNQKHESARNTLRSVAEQGQDALSAAWKALPKEAKALLGDAIPDDIMASAIAFDDQRKDESNVDSDVADLNNEILSNQAGNTGAATNGEAGN